jgi:hypothetical protein
MDVIPDSPVTAVKEEQSSKHPYMFKVLLLKLEPILTCVMPLQLPKVLDLLESPILIIFGKFNTPVIPVC